MSSLQRASEVDIKLVQRLESRLAGKEYIALHHAWASYSDTITPLNPFTCQKVKRRSLTLGLMTMIGIMYGLYLVEPEITNLAIAVCVIKRLSAGCWIAGR